MASEAIIPVSFMPLLVHACESLGFSTPVYACSDEITNNYSVVALGHEPAAYIFVGGPGNTRAESCERAARKMLMHLMTVHGLRVYDVNLERRDEAERSLALFLLKRRFYKSMEQGPPLLPLNSKIPKDQNRSNAGCVSLDFYSVLGHIIERFNVHVTPIEYLQLGTCHHIAWLIVACPRKFCDSEVIVSDQSSCEFDAKQSVSEKTIKFLMPRYTFLVEDANFHFLHQSNLSLKLERESYFTMKEQNYGPVHSGHSQNFLDEELPATPRGPSFRVTQGPSPPIPPKKRRPHALLLGTSYIDTQDFFEQTKHPRIE